MNEVTPPPTLGLFGALSIIWSNWKFVAAFSLIGLAAAVAYLNVATYTYSVSFRVTPTELDTGDLKGKFGGLAAAAGISLGGDRAIRPFEIYVESFYSPEVAARLSSSKDLMRGAFPNEWDERTNNWAEPRGPLRASAQFIKSLLGIPVYPWEKPDPARLQEFIKEKVVLVRDPKKSVTTFSIEHRDPKFAVSLLQGLHQAVDSMIRDRALKRANKYIDYLSLQLTNVTLAEHREALASTLGEQERIRMMSSSDLGFAAEPIGAPIISLHPTKPKPLLLLVLGTLAGGFVSIVILMARQVYRVHARSLKI